MSMEIFLRSKEYWNIVESRVVEPVAGTMLMQQQKEEYEALKLKHSKVSVMGKGNVKIFLSTKLDRWISSALFN